MHDLANYSRYNQLPPQARSIEKAIAAIAGASHQPHRKPHRLFAGDGQ
ncbi:hypothetical protein [Phormidium sp. CCY1219]|nr:hypothetical protein [Phormidium sp. CCY1219]MEB3831476.1 hypothetical protein [Phormidium sp. CCY1219]